MGLQVLLVTLIYYLMASLEWHVTTSWTSAQLPSSSKCNIVYLSVWRLILNDNERCDGQTLHNLLLDNKHWHISYLCIITLVKPVIHEPTKRQHSTIIGGSFITFCTVQPSTVGAHRSSTASCYSSKSHCVLCPQSSTTVCYVVKQFPCLHILTAHLGARKSYGSSPSCPPRARMLSFLTCVYGDGAGGGDSATTVFFCVLDTGYLRYWQSKEVVEGKVFLQI
jgi:hypothetical protein